MDAMAEATSLHAVRGGLTLYLLDYRISTAVLVGLVALVGLSAQTGVVMIVYIDHAFLRRLRVGKIRDLNDITHAHAEGTVLRVRPKLMTVGTMLIGLVPLLWATESDPSVRTARRAPVEALDARSQLFAARRTGRLARASFVSGSAHAEADLACSAGFFAVVLRSAGDGASAAHASRSLVARGGRGARPALGLRFVARTGLPAIVRIVRLALARCGLDARVSARVVRRGVRLVDVDVRRVGREGEDGNTDEREDRSSEACGAMHGRWILEPYGLTFSGRASLPCVAAAPSSQMDTEVLPSEPVVTRIATSVPSC